MSEKKAPVLVSCLMCKGGALQASCSLCQGTGGLAARFKRGFAENQIETTSKLCKESGYPLVYLPAECEETLRQKERSTEVEIDCVPSEDQKTVTLTLTSAEKIGVGKMIRALAHFLKHQCDSHGVKAEDFAIQPTDKTTVIP